MSSFLNRKVRSGEERNSTGVGVEGKILHSKLGIDYKRLNMWEINYRITSEE